MTPAIRRALAYVHATGDLPKHIRMATWSAVYGLTETVHSPRYGRKVVDSALAEVALDPLALAHAYVTDLGFTVEPRKRGRETTHYVAYRHPDHSAEALACRDGSVSIIRVNDARPYRQTLGVKPEAVAKGLPALTF